MTKNPKKHSRHITQLSILLASILTLTACGTASSDPAISSESQNAPAVTSASNTTDPDSPYKYQTYATMSVDEILDTLTLEQKAAQMVMPAIYNVDEKKMGQNDYGGILSQYDSLHYDEWQQVVDGFQRCAVESESGIPYLYGQDDVHGVNYCAGAVIFPHNINMGAANDPELMYQVGLATADEAKLCHMLWNFAPCVAQSVDPRWGRTYECYGSDLELIKSLSVEYTKGLVDGGVVACAKHFFADGNVLFGTGENSDSPRLIDRGNAVLSEAEIEELLSVYQAQIDAGVQTIMISHSALNGTKMHENAKYIQMLKKDMGFDGFIVSDWDSVKNTSPDTYQEQVITAVNAGIDMLMEVGTYDEAMQIIIDGVHEGSITQERVDDAVRRILKVKKDAGLFDDPFMEKMKTHQTKIGSEEYRQLAETLVEESLVLIKNENNTLPIQNGATVYITGPASDNARAQCGGWTIDWLGSPEETIEGVTTILEGFLQKADSYGIHVTTDEEEAKEADVCILVVGEESYAEWYGDTDDISLCGPLGLDGNREAIERAKTLGIPVVTCVIAGRNVLIDEQDLDQWDGLVMCYLPGSEGQGVADVLCGGK